MKTKMLTLIGLSCLISACGAFDYNPNPKLTHSQTCDNLKRQMVYNKFTNNSQAAYTTSSQSAELSRQYKENKCS